MKTQWVKSHHGDYIERGDTQVGLNNFSESLIDWVGSIIRKEVIGKSMHCNANLMQNIKYLLPLISKSKSKRSIHFLFVHKNVVLGDTQ